MRRPQRLSEKKRLQLQVYQLEIERDAQRKAIIDIKTEANAALTSAQEAVDRIEAVVAAEEITNQDEIDWFNANITDIIAAINAALIKTS